MKIELATNGKSSLEKIGIDASDAGLSLTYLFSSSEYDLYIKNLHAIINSFNGKRILFFEDDYYTTNVSDKLKIIKRAVGKIGLIALKNYVIKKEDVKINGHNYFIDMALINGDLSEDVIKTIHRNIYNGVGVYFLLGNKPECTLSYSLLDVIKDYKDSTEDIFKIYFGETLSAERFFIIYGDGHIDNNYSHINSHVVKKESASLLENISKNSTHLYPIDFSKQLKLFESRRKG
ncbi:hypothetical protein [Serratia entomophila]|uniref:hypothetical protein n=1 Tax=Serratia entomophila TaxID=42906 RepID=UPI00217C337D|nr:hypothetical protein [Serratia entomophila]CAI0807403.1 Uncharacterised protein [Serratia entomophila]CAI1586856.1 Uncharacterised protein [Serratia entomophila]CAI1644127.1 Uncharacterised protein [Serratia entomophila]